LALALQISGGSSVGIVDLHAKSQGVCLYVLFLLFSNFEPFYLLLTESNYIFSLMESAIPTLKLLLELYSSLEKS
jgi:hypothetical protein